MKNSRIRTKVQLYKETVDTYLRGKKIKQDFFHLLCNKSKRKWTLVEIRDALITREEIS